MFSSGIRTGGVESCHVSDKTMPTVVTLCQEGGSISSFLINQRTERACGRCISSRENKNYLRDTDVGSWSFSPSISRDHQELKALQRRLGDGLDSGLRIFADGRESRTTRV